MPIITLTSDYGNLDHRVSAIKGSILQLNPDARIIDITHEIGAYNLIQTAYILRNAYAHFPKESVHIVSVDNNQYFNLLKSSFPRDFQRRKRRFQ